MKECEHRFIFLRQVSEEVSWHNWKTYDIFFCEKCLLYEKKEIEKPRR